MRQTLNRLQPRRHWDPAPSSLVSGPTPARPRSRSALAGRGTRPPAVRIQDSGAGTGVQADAAGVSAREPPLDLPVEWKFPVTIRNERQRRTRAGTGTGDPSEEWRDRARAYGHRLLGGRGSDCRGPRAPRRQGGRDGLLAVPGAHREEVRSAARRPQHRSQPRRSAGADRVRPHAAQCRGLARHSARSRLHDRGSAGGAQHAGGDL